MKENGMLGDHLVFPILLSKDLGATRAFYHDVLGLEIMREDEERIVFRCGAGSQLNVTLSTVGTADTQTQLAWRVPDIRAELEDLRARGVRIESYTEPDPVTDVDGIADMDFVWAAWFIDPSGNALSIVQPKSGPTPPSRAT
jgi:catechol 2,3-dioxygenase-like lactoylglutathione lyase family enzyme